MIYTKPIQEIGWDDILEFCDQRMPENTYLDYKEKFPKHLEQTISAMANTLGGVIIIGVEEDKHNNPVIPPSGMEFERGLSEKVMNIILSNITPPVFPEIHVCPSDDSTSSFVLIRIPQSPAAPHAISQKRKIYLRTGDRNKPEDLATIDEIEWLRNNRNKSIDLRTSVMSQFEERYDEFYYRVIDHLLKLNMNPSETKSGILSVSICPTFPSEIIKAPPELLEIHREICIRDYYGTDNYFPPRDMLTGTGQPTLLQDGVALTNFTSQGERLLYTEINSIGFYGYRQPLRRTVFEIDGDQREVLRVAEVLSRLDEFLTSASKFLEYMGYWGYVDFNVSLENIRGIGIYFDWIDSSFRMDIPRGFCPDDAVYFQQTLLGRDIGENRDSIVLDASRKICWAFGMDLSTAHIEHCWRKINRPKD